MKMNYMVKIIGRDVLIAALVMGTFGAYQYLIPKTAGVKNDLQVEAEPQNIIDLSKQDEILNPMKSCALTYGVVDPDAKITELSNYQSEDEKLTYDNYKIETTIKDKKEVIYVTEMYLADVKYLQSGFARGEFGKDILEEPREILQRYNGLIGISGDNYGVTGTGVIVRNGVWYQNEINKNDLCLLYDDGTMETIHAANFDIDAAREKGVWQAWSFGPELLDDEGEVSSTFQVSDYVAANNPRCAIGYVEPGHYLFLVVDGRRKDYSEGLTISEFAELCKKLGCMKAYNLDGGRTATMMNQTDLISIPSDGMDKEGGRDMSDIIYIGENTITN